MVTENNIFYIVFKGDTEQESQVLTPTPSPSNIQCGTRRRNLEKEATKGTRRGKETKLNQGAIYKQVLETLSKTEDEFDHNALAVACKLRKMDRQQQIFCENLINTAVFKGQLGVLNENTIIVQQAPNSYPTLSHTNAAQQPSHQPHPPHANFHQYAPNLYGSYSRKKKFSKITIHTSSSTPRYEECSNHQ